MKQKVLAILNSIMKYSKFIFPIILILAVALTVSLALRAGAGVPVEEESESSEVESVEMETPVEEELTVPTDPLVENSDQALEDLITSYYNAYADGDVDAIRQISNYLDDLDAIQIEQMSNYINAYSDLKLYLKPGPIEDSYLVYVYFQMEVVGFEESICGIEAFYVCTDENGELYLNEGEVSQREIDYISQIALQDDVVELYNEVTVEYNETVRNNTDLFYFLQEMVNEVQKATGQTIADQITDNGESETEGEGEEGSDGEETTETGETAESVPSGPVMATATTTVNVRSSDSENADKLGKVSGGTQVEVQEQLANGWSRIDYNGQDGYIKSEYLRLSESVDGVEVIGQVTAATNINVRVSASETAERLGILAGGETVDLLERADGWCKINYNGKVGYVKEEYVQ